MAVAAKHFKDDQKSIATDHDRRHEFGQFLTPEPLAAFMASLFKSRRQKWDLLDAGAGCGALSGTLVERLCESQQKPESISITAFELDEELIEPLHTTLRKCKRKCEYVGINFSATVFNEDFIAAAVPMVNNELFASSQRCFNAAIVNPPYKKIRSDSSARLLLRSAGIETSNLYTGFVELITRLLVQGGELVAITPRSFCNGPYFKPFRSSLLKTMSLRQLHVLQSRSAAFSRDNVLQENIIIHAVKGSAKPESVIVSSSSGLPESEITERNIAYDEVVSPKDAEQFIHLADDKAQDGARATISQLPASLPELGLSVSTGRVVDFRAKEFLRQEPDQGTAPLIYPAHFNGGYVHWPKKQSRKPNAIVSNEQTRELLVHSGVYVLVKRFTTKEERKRIVACIYDSKRILAPLVGFENHLNYFHINGHGLPIDLAKGLTVFLNSTILDTYFRQFNGHTQVNATDLRNLKYPSWDKLEKLGCIVREPGLPQGVLDALVAEELF